MLSQSWPVLKLGNFNTKNNYNVVLEVRPFTGVSEVYPRPTLVAMISKI